MKYYIWQHSYLDSAVEKDDGYGMKRFIRGSLVLSSIAVSLGVMWPAPTGAANALLTEVSISAENLKTAQSKSFVLTYKTRRWVVPTTETRLWFKSRQLEGGQRVIQLRPGAIFDYLNRQVSPVVNDLGEKSRFSKDGSGAVQLLSGGRKGSIVDGTKTSLAIRSAFSTGKSNATIAMKEHRPALFSAEDFKKMKFPVVLGRGESSFAGSPRNRIHNIGVAVKRYNGLVLQPGEQFSFIQYLGEVDASSGYLPELVIKENVTTPEYGGGICQISTTAFRMAMYSGFPITARRNHSYPVQYYGRPGFDATVYRPSPDLRFSNDTGHPVLITTRVEGTKVIFEAWGTSDGRQVTVNGPFVTQKKPDGSLTAAVAQIVKKNGKSVRETNFVSHYQSPDKFPTIRKANGG